MYLKFKYSLIVDLKKGIDLLKNWREYKNLRSVILPYPWVIVLFGLSSRKKVKEAETIWKIVEGEVVEAFKRVGLKFPNDCTCYIYSVSCEGMFDVDWGNIDVRFYKTGGNHEFIDTIIHELLHLATYKPKMTGDEREKVVDKYLMKKPFRQIIDKMSA